MDLGEYLHDRRTTLRLSLREVEKASGVSKAYLSQLERGEFSNLTIERLLGIAKALRVVPEDLFRVAAGSELSRGSVEASVATLIDGLPQSEQEDMLAMLEAMAAARRKRLGL